MILTAYIDDNSFVARDYDEPKSDLLIIFRGDHSLPGTVHWTSDWHEQRYNFVGPSLAPGLRYTVGW